MKELALAAFSIVASFLVVFLLVGIGWFVVWKLFLSHFKFVRELLGGMSESSAVTELREGRNKSKKARRD